jgi:hypothetical protein
MDEKGKFDLNKANPIVYDHGSYYGLGKKLGTFGYSVKTSKSLKKSGNPVRKTKDTSKDRKR